MCCPHTRNMFHGPRFQYPHPHRDGAAAAVFRKAIAGYPTMRGWQRTSGRSGGKIKINWNQESRIGDDVEGITGAYLLVLLTFHFEL